ncbi:D-serine deaminase, pyridoxal phosphate-dependent [Saccharopolyspora antimicrobica]|uniref:D-serine deaminase, pyridoxal phosphate-dependent n=1 Tax=Saccharopolyspora antimicrobica TaxID=455193 RepID=A0A1I5KAY1_9PSEU|nr:amino acid deaminase [Saccharopolyspora antimicrobica]RKT81928.1 D-serine deaminase-like pyridoxal phosphate-dependent protein [Saccharopolyspora antimicrobica]SFO82128.1 D-serine deaminase, pyridoxal phosphate-dependent [Saccharopolyspora antimicrobica]
MSARGINIEAVRALHDERIDWRFKGMPSDAFGTTVGEFLATRPTVFDGGFVGPLLTLDRSALEHNLRTMADWCAEHGVQLAPHGKTTMAPQLFGQQLAHGSWGITAASISQLRVYRAFGVERILFANELVDARGLAWLADELDRDPQFQFCCYADSLRGVHLMAEALASHGAPRPVDVLVELGNPGGRTGARTKAEASEIADAVLANPMLRLVGVAGYEGEVAHDISDGSLSAVDGYLERVRELVAELAEAGHFAGLDEVIVTAGGSSYFDQVAEALIKPWPPGLPVVPVIRSGGYLLHDDGFYRLRSPFGREHRLAGQERPFRPAMRAWAQVMSRPEPGLALLTMGRRDASFDQDLPEPQVIRGADGVVRDLPEGSARVRALADQHTFLELSGADPQVGDWIGFGLSHPCTVFDKWSLIPVVEDGVVIDLIRTFF